METEGIPRSHFYRRFARALHQVVDRNQEWLAEPVPETIIKEHREPVMRVNLQEAMARLTCCPVCGGALDTFADYPLERSCNSCGDFTILEVWTTGDVVFTFKMPPVGSLTTVDEEDTPVDTNDPPTRN